jgi:hypothetical protein
LQGRQNLHLPFPMKFNPENPPKISKNPPSTALPKNHQQNTKKSPTKHQKIPTITKNHLPSPMKSNPENPPKILRRLHYQKITNKIPKNHQQNTKKTNNHQQSPKINTSSFLFYR